MGHRRRLIEEVVDGLEKFTKDLKDGKPIEATRVIRHETPDGPMHTFEKINLNPDISRQDS